MKSVVKHHQQDQHTHNRPVTRLTRNPKRFQGYGCVDTVVRQAAISYLRMQRRPLISSEDFPCIQPELFRYQAVDVAVGSPKAVNTHLHPALEQGKYGRHPKMYRLGIRVCPTSCRRVLSTYQSRFQEWRNVESALRGWRIYVYIQMLLRRVATLASSSVGGDDDADDYNFNGVHTSCPSPPTQRPILPRTAAPPVG